MKRIVINDDNIKKSEVEEVAIRTKALIINSNNEILLGYAFGSYQFVGGHKEKGESKSDCLIREIEEETGIKFNNLKLKPFMSITHYNKNYRNRGKNRKNIIYYYLIKSNEEINLNNINYDEWEVKGNYCIKKVKMNEIENILKSSINDNSMNELIVKEMLEVIDYYKNNDIKEVTELNTSNTSLLLKNLSLTGFFVAIGIIISYLMIM